MTVLAKDIIKCRAWGFLLLMCFSLNSFAQSGPTNLNVTGALYLPSGSPVTQSGVNFRLEIWDKDSTCLLYTEQHLNEDLSQTKGGFSLAVGKGTSAQNYIDGNSVLSSKVFENYGAQASVGPSCPAGATFTSGDERVIRVSYDLGGGFVAMSPDVPIASSAYAMVAETLQGKRPSDFVQLRDDGTHDLNQTNVENVFSSTNYARLQELLSPTAPIPFSGVRLTGIADPSVAQDAATKNYADTKLAGQTIDLVDVAPGFGGGKVLTWDQAANKWVAMAQNISGTAGGDLTGTYPNPSIANLAIGTSKIQDNAISAAKIQTTGLAANRLLITDATTGATVTYKTCGSDEILKFTTGVGWECASIATYSAVTSVNTKTGAVVLTGADLGLGSASMRNIGIGASNVPDLDGGGKLAASTIPNFSGDITGAYTNAFVARLQGQPISATAPNTNEVLKWNGSRWEPTLLTDNVGITALNGDITAAGTGLVSATIVNNAITTPKVFATPGANRLVATDNTSGATLVPFVCNLDETMKWTASGWGCITVGNLLGNQFIVDGGNARGAAINIGTSDNNDLRLITNGQARFAIKNTGLVGVGTTSPDAALTVTSDNNSYSIANLYGYNSSDNAYVRIFNNQAVAPNNSGFVLSSNAGANYVVYNFPADEFQFITHGGNIPLVIHNAGNVGVGTTSPNRLLDIAGPIRIAPTVLPSSPAAGDLAFDSGASNTLKFHNGTSWQTVGTSSSTGDINNGGNAFGAPISIGANDSQDMRLITNGSARVSIGATGYVGIGTTAPNSLFEVAGSAKAQSLLAQQTGSSVYPSITAFAYTNSGEPQFIVQRARGSAATPTALADADAIGSFIGRAYNGTVYEDSAMIQIKVDGTDVTGSGNHPGGRIEFNVRGTSAPTSFVANPVMVVRNSGNVGIGITTPLEKMHVQSGNFFVQQGDVFINTNQNSTGGVYLFRDNARSTSGINAYGLVYTDLQGTTGNHRVSLVTAGVERIAIDKNGNVGIGTTSPARQLHISGPIRLDPTTLPSSPAAGDLAFDSAASNALKFHNGTSWQTVGTSSSTGDINNDGNAFGTPITIGSTDGQDVRLITNGSARVSIGATGYVGIGTTAPSALLQVVGATSSLLNIKSTGANSAALGIDNAAGGNQSRISFLDAGSIKWQIGKQTDNSFFIYDAANSRAFLTANSGNILLAPLGGNVGIGSTSPTRLLNVAGAINLTPVTTPASPAAGDLFLDSAAGNALKYHNGTNWVSIGSGTGDFLANGSVPMTGNLRLNNNWLSGDGGNEGVFVNSTGNVGIGTTAPSALLDVKGLISVAPSGTINDNGYNGGLAITKPVVSGQYINLIRASTVPWSIGMVYNTSDFAIGGGQTTDSNFNNPFFVIRSNGSVGIGTTNPGGKLEVVDSGNVTVRARTTGGTPSDLTFSAQTSGMSYVGTMLTSTPLGFITANVERMRIEANGNVGIGVSVPTRLLQVAGAMKLNATTAPGSPTAGDIFVDSSASNALKYHNGTSWVALGSGTGDFLANGSVPMTGQFKSIAGTAGAPGISFTGDLDNGIFAPAADNVAMATSGIERMRVLANGNVGIGNTSPAYALDVTGSIHATSKFWGFQYNAVSNGSYAPLVSYNLGAAANSKYWDFLHQDNGTLSLRALDDSYVASNNALVISRSGTSISSVSLPNGNVGIGTTSPAYTLDVNGSINAGGAGTGFVALTGGGAPTAPSAGIGNVFVNSNGMLQCQYGASQTECIPSYHSATNAIGSDITMTTAGTYYTGPSSSLAAGTWLIGGVVTISTTSTTSAVSVTCKLWDGTSTIASTEQTSGAVASASVRQISITLQGIAAPASTATYSIACTATVNGQVLKSAAPDNGAGNNASTLWATRLK